MSIGGNIRRIRIKRGLTQAELGHLAGSIDSMIRPYELGLRTPKIASLEKIAHALGVDVLVLLDSDFEEIEAMHRLIQVFCQCGGSFNDDGSIKFHDLDLSAWHERWRVYQEEITEANKISDEQEKEYALKEAADKFDWWMSLYPDYKK